MVDGVNQQPGLFQRIGNFFGAGNANAGQRTGTPFFPEDPNAGQSTDPFAGLSRAQRTMLGFAALRDAAASLEGRDSNFFQSALGGFEQARERERLRAQGEFANRNQQMLALVQLQALGRATGDPTLANYATNMIQQIMGGVAAIPGVATPTSNLPAAGGAIPGDQFLAEMQRRGEIGVDAQGNLMPEVAPEAEPSVSGVTDEVSRLQAERAELVRRLGAADFVPGAGTAGIEQQIADIDAQLETLATQAQTAEVEAVREERVEPLIQEALDFLVNDDGSVNVLGAFLGANLPLFAGRQARSAISAINEMAAVQAMGSVAEARAQGYTGTLTDADIELITRSGGIFDPMQPEATVRTLERLAPQLSRQARSALMGGGGGGANGAQFTPSDEDRAIVEGYLR